MVMTKDSFVSMCREAEDMPGEFTDNIQMCFITRFARGCFEEGKEIVKEPSSEKKRAFTKEEKRLFLVTAKVMGYRWYFLFLLYFQTGCRRGELLALQWEDVDFINKRITIDKSIGRGDVHGKRVEYLGDTKTEASNRTIPISMKNMLILQLSYEKMKPCPAEFVFKPKDGAVYKWVSLSTVNRVFAEIRDRAGLDRNLTLHCIRHTFATELIAAGVDTPTVQKLGGWSTPKTLLGIYAHSNDESARNALEKVMFRR